MNPVRMCKCCGIDISHHHKNRKYCSSICVNKDRYSTYGQRSTSEQRKEWRLKRLQSLEYIDKLRIQDRNRYSKIQDYLRNYKLTHGCVDCGYNEHHAALEFDHISDDKEFNVCNATSISRAKKEIEKCEVVCSNCHKIRTYNRIQDRRNNNGS